jgi:hypothetical protein
MRVFRRVVVVPAVVLGFFAFSLGSASYYSYNALTDETLIAEIVFDDAIDDVRIAHLTTGDGCLERVFPIQGDQWRVDANFLKWKYWVTLLGLESGYRLDRLEGRYRSVDDQNTLETPAHDIATAVSIDMESVATALPFLVDTSYGSSTYEAVDVTRVFRVYKTPTGIITRSEPRTEVEMDTDVLSIDITHSCGGEPGVWRRWSLWADEQVASLR